MKNKSLITLLPILVAVLMPVNAVAVTAYATVTVNIVPYYSIEASGHAVFSETEMKRDDSSVVSLSTLGTGSATKLKVNSNKREYSVSVSHADPSGESTEHLLQIVDSNFTVDKGSLNEKGEHELEFGGTFDMKSVSDKDSRSDPVYIVMNFN